MATTPTQEAHDVIVIIGAGGMGTAIAQRLGPGKLLVLADSSEENLTLASTTLQPLNYKLTTHKLNITDSLAVVKLATDSAALGPISAVIHTAGLSPIQSSSAHIYAVDLVGTAVVIEAFEPVLLPGSSMVCIASIAGHMATLSAEAESYLAMTLTAQLLQCPAINIETDSTFTAYRNSKRGNILRVKAVAKRFGTRGIRINTVSPGYVSTPMGEAELRGENGDATRKMIENAPIARAGRAEEVAEAVAFLTSSRAAGYVTGTDLVVDGGALAGMAFQEIMG